MRKIFKTKFGFSLIEIMTALVVVSVMLAVLAPVMTSSTGKPRESINVEQVTIDSTPVGVIVAWSGQAVPEGWLPLNGQPIPSQYVELRNTLNGSETLPNYNFLTSPEANNPEYQAQMQELYPGGQPTPNPAATGSSGRLIWIIKAESSTKRRTTGAAAANLPEVEAN